MGKKNKKQAETEPAEPNAAPAHWLEPTWSALSFRLAAATGAGCALLALLRHASLGRACLRGALAWFAILALFRLGSVALRSGWLPGPVDPSAEPDSDSVSEPHAAPDSGAAL